MYQKITAIIPAFNEEKNIGRVIDVLEKTQSIGLISEIIVVNDGSKDKTEMIARNKHVKLINLQENKGKAYAMAEGLKEAKGEFCLFIDGDLVNLKSTHIINLIKPLLINQEIMTVAKLVNGRLSTDIAQSLNTKCSGQRAAKKEIFIKIFKTIKNIGKVKYGIENIITDRSKNFKIGIYFVEWDGVSQSLKEEKWGLITGFVRRIRMYISMNLGHLRNIFYNLSKKIHYKRGL
ncbi:glycosyl transferase family 2 [bacterium CG_4_10_14_0_2_um_filter_33_32]|nr:MAG: hypothetical protein AUJ93_00480 [bacterium CG2_30_33_46]PIR67797.1 MAG: glycosyl transferase family 2 [bacterium CG10_big_fil_rev_8_21_14_0_10_33_18]PIU76824.1 MAG: glycosyl transferase family 2 [bacterium CG06_land_8_20_14_3_00_33_50]PIW81623.1 MAG: glycosyl transferase family 2 [bacterium CG_4_8_14_3_um_filter_33_28]PIY85519.1 MAG: glycosyl transferase family 2 [bacterium CG_4_10_14_0_8_um_filter_33_57]PIZ85498.1 MAG: glycosyl transferase family 2 [bacterium CG_4_10_14_0_2_um_filter